MRRIVNHATAMQPRLKPVEKIRICKILAPERVVCHSSLRQAAIQIQHSNQARPLPTPVSRDENGAAMVYEAAQYMVAVLPHRLDHNDRGFGRNLLENLQAIALAIDKSVPLFGNHRMRTLGR